MNNIGITLTADNKAMIKALQDAEKAMASMGKDMGAALAQVEAQAKQTGQALGAMGGGGASRGLQQATKDMNNLGMSAKATSAALRQVPAQFTDIVVSLQGGQAPLTVLLQQGGQLKDVFGGIGPAARALGGYVLGLVNPFTLAAAAAAVLGLAYKQGSDEADAFRKSLLLTGNAAGTTVDQLAGMAASMDETFGVTTGKAADALNAMAGTGRIARTSLQDFAQVAIDVEKSFGQSIEDTAKNFAELGKDPVGASKRLNESLNYLTAATYAQIKAAMDLGETEKAAAIAQDSYSKAMKGRSDTVVQNLGYIERAYRASLSWAKEAWDAILGIGRADTTAEKMKDVRKELDLIDQGLRNVSPRQRAALEQQLAALQETEKIAKLAGDKQAERVAAEKAGIVAIDQAEKDREKNRRAAEDAAKKAAKEAADARKAELAVGELRNKLVEENAKREAKNLIDMAKLHEASVKPFEQSLKAQEKRVESLEQEEAAIALSEKMNVSLAQAVEMVNIAKLKEQQIDAMGNEDAVAAIQKEIDEREKLVKLIGSKESRDASAKAAKQAASDWQKASDKIQDSITDALLRGFESGKGFAENLRDTVKNMFNTMVLRPIIQAIVGGVTGLGGTAASAGGASGGIGGIAGTINTLKSAYQGIITGFASIGTTVSGLGAAAQYGTAIGSQQSAMLAAQEAGMGTLGGSTAGLGPAASMMGGALVGFMAGKMISGGYSAIGKSGNAAVVAGTAIGAFVGGPIGAAIGGAIGGVVNRAFGMKAKEVTGEGISGTFGVAGADVRSYQEWQQKGGLFRSDKSGVNYSAITSEFGQTLDAALVGVANATKSYAKFIGLSTDAVDNFSQNVKISLKGLDAAGQEKAIGDAIANFGNSMAEHLLGAFEGSKWIAGPYVRAGENAAQALERLGGSLANVNAVFDTLNQTLLASTLAGADAASSLIDVFGGVENFRNVTGAYYQAFYTEGERAAKVTENLKKSFVSFGLSMPDTLAGFRALVEAQDLTTAAGRNTYAAMMTLAPAFAQLTNAATGLAAKLGEVVGSMSDSALVLVNSQITASQNAAAAARDVALAFGDAGDELRNTASQIFGTIGSLQRNTRNAYTSGLASARGGDLGAMQALPGLATAMLSEQRNMARTRTEAELAAAQTAAELMQVADLADAAEAQNNYQAKLYDLNTAILEVLRADFEGGSLTAQRLGEQLKALQAINGLLAGSKDVQTDALDVAEIAAVATGGSESLLSAVLSQLQVPDASAQLLSGNIMSGNQLLGGKLEVLISAVNQQTMAQQTEIRRVQDLARAQKDLEATFGSGARESIARNTEILLTKQQEKKGYDSAIATVAPNYNGWSYGVRRDFDWVWKPGSARLAQEIPALQQQLYGETAAYQAKMDEMRKRVMDLGGIPAFATGGMHSGGIRLVGENGPELEVTGASRIYNAQQTAAMMQGGGDAASEMRAMREELAMLRAEARATAINTGRQADLMKRVTRNGEAMTVQTDLTPLEVTTA